MMTQNDDMLNKNPHDFDHEQSDWEIAISKIMRSVWFERFWNDRTGIRIPFPVSIDL